MRVNMIWITRQSLNIVASMKVPNQVTILINDQFSLIFLMLGVFSLFNFTSICVSIRQSIC